MVMMMHETMKMIEYQTRGDNETPDPDMRKGCLNLKIDVLYFVLYS